MDPGRIESKGSETNPNFFRKVSQGLNIVNMGKLIMGDPNSPPTNDLKKGYAHESVQIVDKSTRFGERTPFLFGGTCCTQFAQCNGSDCLSGQHKGHDYLPGQHP